MTRSAHWPRVKSPSDPDRHHRPGWIPNRLPVYTLVPFAMNGLADLVSRGRKYPMSPSPRTLSATPPPGTLTATAVARRSVTGSAILRHREPYPPPALVRRSVAGPTAPSEP